MKAGAAYHPHAGPRAGLLAGLALSLLLGAAPAASATPAEDFARARNAFTFGNYPEAIRLLSALLSPLQLRDEGQLVEARQLLGVSQYFVRAYFAAQEEFERLLYLRPRHELDPLLFPPPVIEFFEKVRARIRDKLVTLQPQQPAQAPPPVTLLRQVERRHRLLAFFPFGVGQLQNGRAGKALFFLTGELALLATNLVTYGLAEARRLPSGRFSPADEGMVRGLRVAQIMSLAALGLTAIGGVVDALVDFRPEVVTEQRLPGAPAPPAAPPAPARSSSLPGRRLQWSLWATPETVGLSWGVRF